ncbi:MAG: molybdopterin-binding protein [Candidatus Bathyarchaeia archaeon]
MIAEIFAIGDELCYGRIKDTNSFWIADQLTRIGAIVRRITCVRDSLDDICAALGEALERRAQLIVTTGGLGPTSDDLTIEALARLTNKKIVFDRGALEDYALRRGVPVEGLPRNVALMARTLESGECILSPLGGAPATIVEVGFATLIALPGPPREVRALFSKRLKPILSARTGRVALSAKAIVSMRESEISPLVEEISREIPDVYLKPLIKDYRPESGLPIEILAFGADKSACESRLISVVERMRAFAEARRRDMTLVKGMPRGRARGPNPPT